MSTSLAEPSHTGDNAASAGAQITLRSDSTKSSNVLQTDNEASPVQNTVIDANWADAVLSVFEQTSLTPVPPIQTSEAIDRGKRTTVRATIVPAAAEQSDTTTERLAEPVKECIVCRNTAPSIPPDPPTSLCTHPSSVCRKCLVLVIDNGIAGTVRCPTEGCRQELGYADVMKWTRGSKEELEIFDRYDSALLRAAFASDPNFTWCIKPRCHGGQYHEGGVERPLITCHECGTKRCFRHQSPWHDGYSCDRWDTVTARSSRKDDRSQRIIAQITKACPHKGCGVRIQKISGCYNMTCRRCNRYFCWDCLGPFCNHYNSCVHYDGTRGTETAPPDMATALASSPKREWWKPWRTKEAMEDWAWKLKTLSHNWSNPRDAELC